MAASSTASLGEARHSSGPNEAPNEAPLARRPGHYTALTAREICRRLAEGQSLRSICSDRTMPCWETVRRWLRSRPKFRTDYAEAREHQADWLAAEALDAARTVTPATATATRVLLAELHWQAARLWRAAGAGSQARWRRRDRRHFAGGAGTGFGLRCRKRN